MPRGAAAAIRRKKLQAKRNKIHGKKERVEESDSDSSHFEESDCEDAKDYCVGAFYAAN